jgi:hypothetical protein
MNGYTKRGSATEPRFFLPLHDRKYFASMLRTPLAKSTIGQWKTRETDDSTKVTNGCLDNVATQIYNA